MFAGLFAQALALGSDYEYGRLGEFFGSERICTVHGESVDPEAFFLECAKRLVDVAYLYERDAECRTCRSLDDRARKRSLVVLGNEHGRCAECCRATDDGTHILWISEFAQDDDAGVCRGGLYSGKRVEAVHEKRRIKLKDESLVESAADKVLGTALGKLLGHDLVLLDGLPDLIVA